MKEQNREITEIERMAIDMDRLFYEAEIKQTLPKKHPSIVKAEALYNAGYRKQKENTIELPCKIGDTLYVISQMKDKRFLPFINEYEVTSISIKKKSIVVWHEMDGFMKNFKQADFGKTVFLTREEAEKALAKMKGGAE